MTIIVTVAGSIPTCGNELFQFPTTVPRQSVARSSANQCSAEESVLTLNFRKPSISYRHLIVFGNKLLFIYIFIDVFRQ